MDDSQNIEYHTYYASLAFIALYTLLLYLYKIRKIQMVTAFVLSMGVLVLEMGLNTAVTSVTITSRPITGRTQMPISHCWIRLTTVFFTA